MNIHFTHGHGSNIQHYTARLYLVMDNLNR